jgi:hypothetical protein
LQFGFDVKRIQYIMPVDYIAGCISGRQDIRYTEEYVHAYEVASGDYTPATQYAPRMIAGYLRKRNRRYYSIRTKTAVHLTAAARLNLAVMGGAGALYGALVRRGDAVSRWRDFPPIMDMLRTKAQSVTVAGVRVDNPWQVAVPSVPIDAEIVSKFNSMLA